MPQFTQQHWRLQYPHSTTSKRLLVTMPTEMAVDLERVAKSMDCAQAEVLRRALAQFMAQSDELLAGKRCPR